MRADRSVLQSRAWRDCQNGCGILYRREWQTCPLCGARRNAAYAEREADVLRAELQRLRCLLSPGLSRTSES